MNGDYMTPGRLAKLLDVSDRTVRRMATAYDTVFTDAPLPPDPRNSKHRVFPPVAVERVQHAAALMRDHPGLSTVEALTALRDGRDLPLRHDRPTPHSNLETVLEELRALRDEVADLRRLLLASQSHGSTPATPALASEPAPAPAEAPAAPQRPKKLQPNHQNLVEALERGERLRVRPGGRTGETAELFDVVGEVAETVDPRTVAALVRYGLLEKVGDEYRLTAEKLL